MNGGEVRFNFKGDDSDISKKAEGLESKLNGIGKSIGGAFLKGSAVVGTALTGMVAQSVKSYAEFEQIMGGTELLFGEASDFIVEKSKTAFKDVQMSQVDYLTQTNGLITGLKEAMGGNIQMASELADKIVKAEADVVSATGVSQEAVQNAFNGIMKGNYTMVDNLQLGINATKSGVEEMITKVNDWNKAQGKSTQYTIDNVADVQQALVDYIEMQGLSGYASKEGADTIQGAMASAKASFQDFLTGAGDVQNVITTFNNLGILILDQVIKLAPQIITGIVGLINGILPQLPNLIKLLLPSLIDGIMLLTQGIIEILPDIISIIAEMLPDLLPQIVDGILQLIPLLIDNLPLFLKAGGDLLIGLYKGIVNMYPVLWDGIVNIVKSIIGYYKQLPSMMKEIGGNLIKGLWEGISNLGEWAISKIKGLGKSILNSVKDIFGVHSPSTEFSAIGKFNMIGLIDGTKDMKSKVIDAYSDVLDMDNLGTMFDINPSLYGNASTNLSPNVNVIVNNNMEVDPIGQVVNKIKTFSGGAKNDYNWGASV